MNTEDKNKFVSQVCNDLKESILKFTEKMPQEWNGFELRQFIADYYAQHYLYGDGLRGTRKKEYENFLNINNLI